jgi:tight adherence protein C
VTTAVMLAGLAAALAAGGAGLLVASVRRGSGASGASAAPRDRAPALMRLLVKAGAALRAAAPPRDLEARIVAAGRPAGLRARDLMAAKLAAGALGALAGAGLAAGAPGRLAVVLIGGAPVAGFLAPDLWLARRAADRARRIRRDLPSLLDLLRVAVESGSSLAQALREVGARTHGPLAAEWRSVGRQVNLGVPLELALDGMAERAPLPEVRALRAALDRARRHGAPLGETLAAQARDARFALARHAREEAARAGPKIQLVVALLLVPSVLLLVAAALLSALIGGGAAGALSS